MIPKGLQVSRCAALGKCMTEYGLTNAADSRLIGHLARAGRRIVSSRPASRGRRHRVGQRRRRDTPRREGAVQVLLDVDSEVCRLGYGTLSGLKLLRDRARSLHATIAHQPGIESGILVSDDATLVFCPTPLLVEGSSRLIVRMRFSSESVPTAVATDLGLQWVTR